MGLWDEFGQTSKKFSYRQYIYIQIIQQFMAVLEASEIDKFETANGLEPKVFEHAQTQQRSPLVFLNRRIAYPNF